MKPKAFNPRRLDVDGFAGANAVLEGEAPLSAMSRLAGALIAGSDLAGQVRWRAAGARRRDRAGIERAALVLHASAELPLQCQRCLAPLRVPVAIERPFVFAKDEGEAAQLDDDSDDDVLVRSRAFDLIELLEDELILALPLVPRHDVCPQPLVATAAEAAAGAAAAPAADAPRDNPFRVLEALRRGG